MYSITVEPQFLRTSEGNRNWEFSKWKVASDESHPIKLQGICFINAKKATDNNIGFTSPTVYIRQCMNHLIGNKTHNVL